MKKLKIIKYLFTGVLAIASMVSCDIPEDNSTLIPFVPGEVENPETISQIIIATPELSILERAMRLIEAEGDVNIITMLNVPGAHSIFAPTDAAFEALLEDSGIDDVESVPLEDLTNIILNHVVVGKFLSTDLATGYIETSAFRSFSRSEDPIKMYVDTTNGVELNGESTVTNADNEANNGVIHIVDAVLTLPNIADFIAVDPRFSSLMEAIKRADTYVDEEGNSPGIEDALRDLDNSFTVFAPNNEAFAKLLLELDPTGETGINDIEPVVLVDVIYTHVLEGNRTSDDFITAGYRTVNDNVIFVDADALTITDSFDRVSNIITDLIDIQSRNGVIHTVDGVILPPAPEMEP